MAAARTAGGRRGGRLSGWHPADLAAQVIDALLERTNADPALVEDVIMGCVLQAGEQSGCIGRMAGLASKLPKAVPGVTVDDIDLFEVNEAFASVPLAWLQDTGADPARLNVNGGAIALGHPLGASGTRLMTTLVHALQARGKRYGLQTMCEGGGQANVTIVERLG